MANCKDNQGKRAMEALQQRFTDRVDPALFFEMDDLAIFPGFCDVHVHLREPGFFYKETTDKNMCRYVIS